VASKRAVGGEWGKRSSGKGAEGWEGEKERPCFLLLKASMHGMSQKEGEIGRRNHLALGYRRCREKRRGRVVSNLGLWTGTGEGPDTGDWVKIAKERKKTFITMFGDGMRGGKRGSPRFSFFRKCGGEAERKRKGV